MKNVKEYYKLLGKLAYSVAIADGYIQPEEKEMLERDVLNEFALHESGFDTSGMNKAFYVDFEFEESNRKHPDLNETLKAYSEFIEVNYEPNDNALIQRSVKLLDDIANACSKQKEQNIVQTIRNKINSTLYI